MLEVKNLATSAGNFHLAGITLSVRVGECHAVLGPSGSGKSTLLSALLGTRPISSGQVLLGGEEITQRAVELRRLGYLPQQLGLFPHLAVRDNLTYSARARRLPRDIYQPLLDKLVAITGIGQLLDRRPATLSGGELQRVALVRALAADPKVVLLDEPFAALNESLRRDLWQLMKELQQERGLSTLLITHNLTEAYALADHITVLIDGRQEQSGDRASVFRRPQTLAVARFLGIKNLFPAQVAGVTTTHIEADCPILNQRFMLPGNAPTGTPIFIGIRPEDIALRNVDHPPRSDEKVFNGTIRLLDFGVEAVLHFQPAHTSIRIESVANWRTVSRFGLTDGKSDVTIGLPDQAMFWVHE